MVSDDLNQLRLELDEALAATTSLRESIDALAKDFHGMTLKKPPAAQNGT